MKKNDLNKIFVKTKIKNDNGKSINIPNTAQNLYLNPVSKKKQLKSIQQETFNQVENDSEESESSSSTESESDSEEDELEKINDDIIDESNIEQIDNNESDIESETEETENEEETETETETETNAIVSEVIETDYNDDKDTDIKNEDYNEDCLYEYDEILDDKESDKKEYQIPQEERITDKQLTHYEKVRILGVRSKQIAMGAKVMVKYDTNMSSIELAKYELNNKMTPLIIKRPLPNNSFEMWKISELTIDNIDNDGLIDNLNKTFKIDYNINL